jgi:hypothetical protein
VYVAIRRETFREAAAGFVIEDAHVWWPGRGMGFDYIVVSEQEGGSSIDDDIRPMCKTGRKRLGA